jgi:hypothetical protein
VRLRGIGTERVISHNGTDPAAYKVGGKSSDEDYYPNIYCNRAVWTGSYLNSPANFTTSGSGFINIADRTSRSTDGSIILAIEDKLTLMGTGFEASETVVGTVRYTNMVYVEQRKSVFIMRAGSRITGFNVSYGYSPSSDFSIIRVKYYSSPNNIGRFFMQGGSIDHNKLSSIATAYQDYGGENGCIVTVNATTTNAKQYNMFVKTGGTVSGNVRIQYDDAEIVENDFALVYTSSAVVEGELPMSEFEQ